MQRVLLALASSCLLAAPECAAQSTGVLPMNASVSARLRDGSMLLGRISEQLTDSVQITTANGVYMIARSSVSELKLLSAREVRDGGYWPADPHDTRLFFGPTGRTLAAGSGYFSDTYVLLFNGAIGITDRIMIGAGMSMLPVSDFARNNVFYVAPKLALVRGEAFNLSVGAIVGATGATSGSASMYYVAATNGAPDASFTYGLGYASVGSTVDGSPLLLLGGNKRVARRVSLMTENYVILSRHEPMWAPLYGVRFIGDRLSTDLGLVNYLGHNAKPVFPGVPWLGFALAF
ncbi:MAG: hypothetical protein ACHQSE_05735 [Gemmatimonadales bacterium]